VIEKGPVGFRLKRKSTPASGDFKRLGDIVEWKEMGD
jgi:hypothetical protein